MKNDSLSYFLIFIFSITTSVCCAQKNKSKETAYKYIPDNLELYNTIVAMDSTFFQAYNTCDLDKQAIIYSDNIEFYHDKGGLMTVKQELLDGTKQNICGKVTRELVKGSIEVYPIKDFGAIEMGVHKFHKNTEKADTPSHASKFIIFWKKDTNNWTITKVVSLH
jgi:ketosteroid isomerase-like protein